MKNQERRVTAVIALLFVGATISACLFVYVFWNGNNDQLEGATAGISFMCLAIGLVLWAHHLLPEGPYEEEYPELRSPASEEAEVLASLDRGQVGRRKILLAGLGTTGMALTAGIISTFRSMGPGPYTLSSSPWKRGMRLVTPEGRPVHVADVPVNSIVSVLPEGFLESPMAPAELIHLPPHANVPLPGRATWTPGNFICYSKVCTHAGCAVNQYVRTRFEMQCPCHQSTFSVIHGGVPVFGPASKNLPQLPLTIAPDGILVAGGDLSAPPGPEYWHYQS